MSTIWIVSLAFAWVVIALLTACVVTLLRQVGELRARLGGTGAPAAAGPPAGPELYDAVEPVELALLGAHAATVVVGGEQQRPALLVVHAPGCSSCADIEQALQTVARERAEVAVLSVIALPQAAAARHAAASSATPRLACVALEDVPQELVPDGLPALVAIAREGVVAAVGEPDTIEHLREAADVVAGAVVIAGPDSLREMEWGRAVPAWGVDDDAPALDIVHVEAVGEPR